MSENLLDKSINPYRDDLAAIKLKGQVKAEKFVEPIIYQVKNAATTIKAAPNSDATQISEALAGELIDIYEIKDGFAWGQLQRDNYVGYFPIDVISNTIIKNSHKIKVLRTYGFAGPKVEEKVLATLSIGAEINPNGEKQNGYVNCGEFGWIYENHICPIDEYHKDPIEIAKLFLNAPYLWGGKQSLGLDCSGLAQIANWVCGKNLPRDAYVQETCGIGVDINPDLSGLKRGDLVFWQGHVAMMIDDSNIIHANAFHMCVAIEPLEEANQRYIELGLPIRNIRRI